MGWKWWNKQDNEHSKQPQKHSQTELQPTYETQTYYKSYSSSRSCKPDPEDQNYLICKEKIQDGNQTYEKEERVPVNSNQSLFSAPFTQPRTFFRNDPFAHHHGTPTEEFQALNKAMEEFMTPFFHLPSIFGFGQFPNFDRNYPQPGSPQIPRGQQTNRRTSGQGRTPHQQGASEDRRQGDQKYYFSHSDDKSYDIKDI